MKNGPAMTGQRKIWKDKSKFYDAGGRQLPPAAVCKKKTPGCTGGSGEALAMMKK